ncbi:HNH endonuclease signature motif containing protein [Pantoea agglomerans]|uniref:HNH endonuclease signature motif containing protein n=1 Tax=Enterobacter agglomerans TaxID=549 RepID=UPI003207B9B2
MSRCLPGTDLYYLAGDNVPPEQFERIMPPEKAWHRVQRDFCFDDTTTVSGYIVNMRPKVVINFRDQAPKRGLREEKRMLQLIYTGEVVMIDHESLPGDVFFINSEGKLICTRSWLFSPGGSERILSEFVKSVQRRAGQYRDGKPRPTAFAARSVVSSPEQYAEVYKKPGTFAAINSRAAGRLLAAGAIYNQNPEMYADTASKLGGDAAAGFSEVLNQQTAGSLIALSSILAIGRGAIHPVSVTELEKLKSFLGTYKGEKNLLQNIDVVKMDYIKRPSAERIALRNQFDKTKKSFLKEIVDSPDVQGRLSTDDLTRMTQGNNPVGWDVHHKLPLDDSGTNDFSNLVLISKSPEHAMFTTTQQRISRSIAAGGPTQVLWPVPKGVIYP